VGDERCFQRPFGSSTFERDELEVVGILCHLLHKLRLARRQESLEVRRGTAYSPVQARHDLVLQYGAGPTGLDSLPGIPLSLVNVVQAVEQRLVVPPREFPYDS
jgi:hypothetical protein